MHRADVSAALGAYGEWAKDTRMIVIRITDPGEAGIFWEVDLPEDVYRSRARLRAEFRRGGEAWETMARTTAPGTVVLGDYPAAGDVITLRW